MNEENEIHHYHHGGTEASGRTVIIAGSTKTVSLSSTFERDDMNYLIERAEKILKNKKGGDKE